MLSPKIVVKVTTKFAKREFVYSVIGRINEF